MAALVQIVGALLILVAFGLGQAGVMSQTALSYLVLNFVGATVLTVAAYVESSNGASCCWRAPGRSSRPGASRGSPLSPSPRSHKDWTPGALAAS
jgi:hypothetical protein